METKKEASFGEWCEVCPICKSDAVPFLSSLPEDQKRCLMEDAVQKEFRKGSCLFEEGEAVENLIILLSGKIKMVRYDGEGREMILGIFGSGETIWEGILKEGAIFPYSGVCMTDVWACMIDRKVFVGLLGDSSVALHVISMLSDKLQDANTRNMLLSTRDPKTALAAFLLYQEKKEGHSTVLLRLEDIAASIGIRSETVSRKIGELCDENLIEREGRSGIRILDAEKLSELAAS